MNRKNIITSILLVALGSVLTVLSLPDKIFMPSELAMGLLFLTAAALTIFLIFIWRENPADEREAINQHLASRYAYVAGSAILVATIIVRGLQHKIDPFVAAALFVMIASKTIMQNFKDRT